MRNLRYPEACLGEVHFRNGAYRPETEEGRKTLAHELTHVAQYEEGTLDGNISRAKLEKEAELAENTENFEADPIVTLNLNGRTYRFRKSKMKYYAHKLAEKIQQWVHERKFILEEKEYLRLLLSYEKWLKSKDHII